MGRRLRVGDQMAEERPEPMGRTNYIILVMGGASMLVLSLLMKQFLHRADTKRSPVIHEIAAMFGERLSRESELKLRKTANGTRATVTVYPMMGTPVPRLAHEVGHHVWRRFAEKQLTSVDVVCQWSDQQSQRFQIPQPEVYGRFKWPPQESAQQKSGGPKNSEQKSAGEQKTQPENGEPKMKATSPPPKLDSESSTATPPAPVPGREPR